LRTRTWWLQQHPTTPPIKWVSRHWFRHWSTGVGWHFNRVRYFTFTACA
jgi:hypothetical protein